MKKVSRKKNRLAIVMYGVFLFAMVLGGLVASIPIMLFALLPFAVGTFLYLTGNKCPHCGSAFRGLYWSKPNAGYCNKCGKIIAFDE
jgi:hypothetical protein